jgi:glyoxylase-like metal-dependent hydrolase (beta-lactamase superfamily II)
MNSFQITTLPNGQWRQNCYILSSDNGQAIIFDPGSDAEMIQKYLDENKLEPLAILNTHAHYDHVGAVVTLMDRYEIPFYLHAGDEKLLKQANLYKILFESKKSIKVPVTFDDLSSLSAPLKINNFSFDVLSTPGHTPGSVCFLFFDTLFSGDTLMPNGPGRTDLPGGNKQALALSLDGLRKLPYQTIIYPGHGKPLTLEKFWGLTGHA